MTIRPFARSPASSTRPTASSLPGGVRTRNTRNPSFLGNSRRKSASAIKSSLWNGLSASVATTRSRTSRPASSGIVTSPPTPVLSIHTAVLFSTTTGTAPFGAGFVSSSHGFARSSGVVASVS